MNNMNSIINIKSIKDLIKDYKYGQYSILDNKFEINCDISTKSYLLKNLYAHEALSLKGSCTELMITAYAEIEAKHPEYHVTRVRVNEPYFFPDEDDCHWAILVSEKELLKTKGPADKKEIEKIVMQDPVLVDPSFKIVEHISKTEYKILEAYVEGVESAFYDSEMLIDKKMIPIWYSNEAECMAYLKADTQFKSGLGIVIDNKNLRKLVEQPRLDINSKLVKTIHDDTLRTMIEIIQKKEIKYTTNKTTKIYKTIIS
jgi:hypothetical protein